MYHVILLHRTPNMETIIAVEVCPFTVNKWNISHKSHEEKWKQIPLLVNTKYSAPNSGSQLHTCLESCVSQYTGVSHI